MRMNDRTVEINFQTESFRMENALIAGQEIDGKYTAMYIGQLDLDDLHNALFYVNMSVLKILTKQLGIDLNDCDDFLLSAISEALTKEWNVQNGHAPDVKVEKVVKYRRD